MHVRPRSTGLAAGVVAVLSLLLGACRPESAAAPRAAATTPAPASDAGLVERGRYLVQIASCHDCHTPGFVESQGQVPQEQWLTGSAPMGYHGPWGTTYATNLRLRMQELDEAQWLEYSAHLHTRPMMPDIAVRAMDEEDRRALYRYIRSLGPAGQPAPAALPPGQVPAPPYLALVLPDTPAQGGENAR